MLGRILMGLTFLLAISCGGSETGYPTAAPPPTATPFSIQPIPTAPVFTPGTSVAPTSVAHTFRFTHPPTLDWQILDSPTIVVATLQSATAAVEQAGEAYRPMHVLTFRSSEYLKGTGPQSFAVEVPDTSPEVKVYTTRADALAAAASSLAQLNKSWDNREGVIFLSGPHVSVVSHEGTTGPSSSHVYGLTNNYLLQ